MSLALADASGLLEQIPGSSRYLSFHLISQDEAFSEAQAIPVLLGLLPPGFLGKALASAPGIRSLTSLAYDAALRIHEAGKCVDLRTR
jgi:hypothetical protein